MLKRAVTCTFLPSKEKQITQGLKLNT
jgi:hypothetical protein